jgi:glycosyltransferase involved in cell wall biosynthesis
MEKITYLVANYNNGKYIQDCIDSLNHQTDPNWLCLILDDHSTDNSLNIIKSYLNDKIQLLTSESNVGYILVLKKLIESAKTDIVAILDSDDALYPEATENLLKVYRENPEAGFVYSKSRNFDEKLKVPFDILGKAVPLKKTSLQEGFISHIKSFRIRCYRKTEGIDDSILYAEDRDLIYKLEEVTAPIFIDKVLHKHRLVPNSQSTSRSKIEIGTFNHFRAVRNAIIRRRIRGIHKLFYYSLHYGKYICACGKYSKMAIIITKKIIQILYKLDRIFELRSTGVLRR